MVNAREVKQVLKENGINTKKIGVRCLSAGYEQVIRVTLKDIYLPLKKIEAIVKDKFEHVYYEERTMEILAGGNTFVQIEYDYDTDDGEEIVTAISQKGVFELRYSKSQGYLVTPIEGVDFAGKGLNVPVEFKTVW